LSALTFDDLTVQKAPTRPVNPEQSFVAWNALVVSLCEEAAADSLGLDSVAEGVEKRDQIEFLQSRRCSQMQGYYFCRPTTFIAAQLPARRLAYMRVLAALNRENVSKSWTSWFNRSADSVIRRA